MKTIISALTLALTVGATASAALAATEPNSLACPGSATQTEYQSPSLQLNGSSQFDNSGMFIRVTRVEKGPLDPRDGNYDGTTGYTADILLPTITLRGEEFYGRPRDGLFGPVKRVNLCGKTYELQSMYGFMGDLVMRIKILPAGF